ncbi:hypothetical protein GALMADRAFT_1051766 [Galerina marginata CBS 339.88]|uniref:Uncharacterized protein n=1 Tax=Galerina marginata (strain CBS 339.88) TaxID=685588 RepID=A0A067SDN4_GALM3|nr:hypothetical protein GALMADRAFT_1051766 [Galerina marginata CBS 339.88]
MLVVIRRSCLSKKRCLAPKRNGSSRLQQVLLVVCGPPGKHIRVSGIDFEQVFRLLVDDSRPVSPFIFVALTWLDLTYDEVGFVTGRPLGERDFPATVRLELQRRPTRVFDSVKVGNTGYNSCVQSVP